jgi:hypothetical protein
VIPARRLGTPLLVAALLGTACAAPAPPPPPPEPEPLAYRDPPGWAAYYTVADTAHFSVDSGAMGTMTASAAYDGTARVVLSPGPDAFEARVRFPVFDGVFRAQPDGVRTVDERDVAGEFTVRLDGRGHTQLVEAPSLSDAALDVTGPESLVRPLFVHLPGRPAAPGDFWVDTVRVVETGRDTRSEVVAIITTTLVGDTIVDERPLLLLRTRTENHLDLEGRSGGVLVRQRLTGTTTGTVLWDDLLHLLVARREDGQLAGTLDMPAAGVTGLPMTARVRRVVELQRGEPEPDPPTEATPPDS